MRKTMVIGSFVLALCSMKAQAQMMEVYDNMMSSYDVAALKGGEWVETETKMEIPGVNMPATKSKMACVKADADNVWIESSASGMVTCYQIAKKDRKIVKAWSGQEGAEGKEMTVKPAPSGGAGGTTVDYSGTAKGSKEKLTVAGKEIDCVKVVMETTTKMSGQEFKSKSTSWYSTAHPFKMYVDSSAKDPNEGKIKWEGDKPEGNMVKMETEANNTKTVTQVSGWGTDAKPSLKIK